MAPLRDSGIAVSIVVPIHNAEPYLRECLESLVRQTLPDIEILCYDDASTDSSGAIAAQFAAADPRVSLISYPENRSAAQSRKDGALAARGRYLMFVDADDYLELDACADLVGRMSELDVDVLQFGTNIVSDSLDRGRIRALSRFLAPLRERLSGTEPFNRCFLTGDYGHSVWNKIYRSSVAKRAFEEVPDGRYPKGQDVLAYFALAWQARSYQGISERYYNYRFGAGVTGAEDVSLERLAQYAEQSLVADAVDRFAAEHEHHPELPEAAYRVRQRLASDCVLQWFRHTALDSAAQGFDILTAAWPMEDIAAALHRHLHTQRQGVARRIEGAAALARQPAPIPADATLGVFYHWLSIGGIQRVLSILIPLYLRMGYRVVMLLDAEHPSDAFALPPEVHRLVLPTAGTDYRARGQQLRRAIRAEGIDALIHCGGSSEILLYDLLATKAEGIPFILSMHNSGFSGLLSGSRELAIRPAVTRLADVVQVLSEAELAYWGAQGANAVFVPNPLTTEPVDESELATEPGMLLWVGRLDLWVKRCLDVVEAMAIVARSQPDARLYLVGDEWTPGSSEQIRERISRLGMEERVILCGPTLQIEDYYRRADVLLITSVTECSPMSVVEARAFGLPIAMYSLPHLASLSDGKGFISVPQGDAASLARAIVSILTDRELRGRLSRAGREGLARQAAVDLAAEWRRLFDLATGPRPATANQPLDSAVVGALLSNALDIYTQGTNRKRAEIVELRRQITELQSELARATAPAARRKQPGGPVLNRVRRTLKAVARRLLPRPVRARIGRLRRRP